MGDVFFERGKRYRVYSVTKETGKLMYCLKGKKDRHVFCERRKRDGHVPHKRGEILRIII